MGKLRTLALRAYGRLEAGEWAVRLVVRVAVGLMFFGGALKKVSDIPGLVQYFTSLGIPAANVQAPFVAGTELVASALLMVGFLTRPAAVALSCIMLVALWTAGIPEHHIAANWKGLLDFLYLSDWLLLLLLVWILFAGPGRASLDSWIFARQGKEQPGRSV